MRTPPWRAADTRNDALNTACNVRDFDPDIIEQALWIWPQERVIKTLMAAVAMIDVERPVSHLLAWDRGQLTGTCKNGHPRNKNTTRIDPNGTSLRCRICERERKASQRRKAAA
jgi:hypothetical protein